MSKLLQVPVRADDNLSEYTCRGCKLSATLAVEKKLQELRDKAQSSYREAEQAPGRKRTKDTSSGPGISVGLFTMCLSRAAGQLCTYRRHTDPVRLMSWQNHAAAMDDDGPHKLPQRQKPTTNR